MEKAVAFEIRRQLDLACLSQANDLKNYSETIQLENGPKPEVEFGKRHDLPVE